MSLDSPHEHVDLLAPAEPDEDECCGGANRASGECRGEGRGRGNGRGRGEGRCCGGEGRGDCENADIEAGPSAVEAKQPQATA